jgi:hypothetical protein
MAEGSTSPAVFLVAGAVIVAWWFLVQSAALNPDVEASALFARAATAQAATALRPSLP